MKVIKCKCFMISKLTNKYKYFAFFLLGSLFRVLFPYLLEKILEKKKDNIITKINEIKNDINNNNRLNFLLTQKYIEILRNIISDLFLGFFHCFYRVKNRDESQKRQMQTYNTNSQKINYIFNTESSRVPITLKYIFLISIVDIICQMIIPLKYILEHTKILNTDPNRLYILLFFDIFARYIFSRWLLKTYFYAHHKFSFFLNFLGLILIGIVDLKNKFVYSDEVKQNKYNFDLLYIGILSIQLILYSFEDIMNKIAFRRLGILPSTLLFYNGLFLLAYFIIISLFYFICGIYNIENEINKSDYFLYELQYSIIYIPFNILRNYNILNVIDKFSAAHMTFLRVSETVIIFFYNIIIDIFSNKKDNTDDIWEMPLQSIGFILLIVSTLIHNEIIIINHPKLKAKTEYYLDKDADREQISSFYSDTFFTDSKDESESHSNLYDDLTGSDIS